VKLIGSYHWRTQNDAGRISPQFFWKKKCFVFFQKKVKRAYPKRHLLELAFNSLKHKKNQKLIFFLGVKEIEGLHSTTGKQKLEKNFMKK
jgi:hypothetical protein